MIDEALDCVDTEDLVSQFERLLDQAELSDDELLFVAPELYFFKRVLDQIRRHPYTRRHPQPLRHVSMVGLLGDLMLYYQ